MTSETKPTLHERICLDLDRQLKFANNIKVPSVPISRLTARGFRVEQVEPGDGEEKLNFSPCFFKPVESSFLIENPVREHFEPRPFPDIVYCSEDEDGLSLGDIPLELQDYVWDHVEAYRRPLEASRSDEWVTLERTCPLRWSSRCASPVTLFLAYVLTPSARRPLPPVHDYTRPFILGFQTRDLYEDRTYTTTDHWHPENRLESPSGEYPHMIVSIYHEANGHSRSLTKGEVKLAVRLLHFRHNDPLFSKFDVLPVRALPYSLAFQANERQLLIVSYMGPKHGRILQAHHNGERIVLQCSPLMSF